VQFSYISQWKPEIFHQNSKKMDQELFYNCAATYIGIITTPLILKKKQKNKCTWVKH
jgi:hypothetical protein